MTDPRIRQRRIDVARQAGRRRLRVLLCGTGAVALAGCAVAVLHSPLFSVRTVTVVGAPGIPRSAVLLAAGLGGHPPLVDVDLAAVERRLTALPQVATAEVREEWPSGVEIVLTERRPVAVAAGGPGGDGSVAVRPWVLLDSTGRVLGFVGTPPPGLPVVVPPSPPGLPGTALGAPALPLLAVAGAVPTALVPQVAAIGYDRAGDIVLDLRGEPNVVLGPATDLRQKFVSLTTVLADVSTSGISTIDLSVPAAPVLTPTGHSRTVQAIAGG